MDTVCLKNALISYLRQSPKTSNIILYGKNYD